MVLTVLQTKPELLLLAIPNNNGEYLCNPYNSLQNNLLELLQNLGENYIYLLWILGKRSGMSTKDFEKKYCAVATEIAGNVYVLDFEATFLLC